MRSHLIPGAHRPLTVIVSVTLTPNLEAILVANELQVCQLSPPRGILVTHRMRETAEAPAAVQPSVPPTLTAMKSRFAALERVPTLFALQGSQLRLLARRARQMVAPEGTTITRQQEAGDSMYVLLSGRCEVSVSDSPGHSLTVAVLGPDEAFGEEAAVLSEPRLATVKAVENTDLLVLDRSAITAVIAPDSEEMNELQRLVEQRKTTTRLIAGWADTMSQPGTSQKIAVYSPKGGAGRTTLALNLAAQLARGHPAEVVVVDLSLPFNNAALMGNLVPVSSLAQLATTPGGQFEESLLSAILPHSSGFMILPTVLRPEQAELITLPLVQRAVEVLRRSFRYLIIDLGTQLTDTTLSMLERADRLLLLVTTELSALKDATELQRIFGDVLRIPPPKVMVVLNHRSPKGVIGRQEVERQLGRELLCELQFEGSKLDEAWLNGDLLSLTEPRSSMARGMGAIVDALSAEKDGQPKAPRRIFGHG